VHKKLWTRIPKTNTSPKASYAGIIRFRF